MREYKENKELRILSAIGIILVAAGHLGYNLFDIGGLFPYYSFILTGLTFSPNVG